MSKIIIAAAVVSVVILLECGMAYMLIPSTAAIQAKVEGKEGEADAHAAPADAHAAPAADAHGGGHGDAHGGGHGDAHGGHGEAKKPAVSGDTEIEQDLGKFNVVVHQPATNVTLRINFQLVASTLAKDSHEVEALIENNKHRLRDQVIYEIRNSDINDLTDPGLGLIKRKILAKNNELLGKPLFKAIYFSDFSFIEQ